MNNGKIIFSGIQPSGDLHIGNYLGAIKQWVNLQNSDVRIQNADVKLIFMLADFHSITVPQNPATLKKNTIELAAWFIAAGLDTNKTSIFIQSENPDHAYLTWIFDCITPMGWMERMTQFKDKSKKQGERTSVGLFHYPNLMASDILLYDTDYVPVGDDQTQHLELTRDVAEKFNRQFGDTFKLPKIMLQEKTSRIMSLQNPLSKMSKSDESQSGCIYLLDKPDIIRKKIIHAITDSSSDVLYADDKPEISNLLTIYEAFSEKTISEIEDMYKGKGYGDFKKDLAEVVVEGLKPIQERYQSIMNDQTKLNTVLDKGRDTACEISSQKIKAVQQAVGLGR